MIYIYFKGTKCQRNIEKVSHSSSNPLFRENQYEAGKVSLQT